MENPKQLPTNEAGTLPADGDPNGTSDPHAWDDVLQRHAQSIKEWMPWVSGKLADLVDEDFRFVVASYMGAINTLIAIAGGVSVSPARTAGVALLALPEVHRFAQVIADDETPEGVDGVPSGGQP